MGAGALEGSRGRCEGGFGDGFGDGLGDGFGDDFGLVGGFGDGFGLGDGFGDGFGLGDGFDFEEGFDGGLVPRFAFAGALPFFGFDLPVVAISRLPPPDTAFGSPATSNR